MPEIIPYRALLYGTQFRSQLGDLLSPPYDVISPAQFQVMKKLNPHQSIRLALSENPDDPDRYEKMKSLLNEWKQEGVLQYFDSPAFYLIEDQFESEGKPARRVGFVALLEVSSFEKKQILPHEHTLSGPKKDRFELLKTMRAEVSQIFLCYKDNELKVEKIFEELSKTEPLLEASDSSNVKRRMWPVTDPQSIKAIQNLIQSRPALIADGHHRYETALAFASESKYTQVYFTNLNSPGFSIHPIHRLFSLPENIAIDQFLRKLSDKFEVIEQKEQPSLEVLKKKCDARTLALFCSVAEGNRNYLLTKNRDSTDDAEIFSIHKEIFESILGWDVKQLAKGTISYEHDTHDYLNTLKGLKRGIGLFLPPTDLDLVMRLAERGERMPQKSTFFFPKLASGLINFDLDRY